MALRTRLAVATVALACLLGKAAAAERLEACERVEVSWEDASGQRMARDVGQAVCRGMQRIGPLFGGSGRMQVMVRICSDMESFRRLTGRPWYVSAVVLGEQIVTQPANSLRKLDDLSETLVHELAHLLIRRTAGRNCPRWLEEGLAQWLAAQKPGPSKDPRPALPVDRDQLQELEKRLKSPSSNRGQLERDYLVSLLLTGRLIDRVGERTLIKALGGLKKQADPLNLPLRDKPLSHWIFHIDD